MSQARIRKAVFPVAGLGTRLLPATKTIPKEMITIVDRPLIQYAVDEARDAGIETMIFVTGPNKAPLDSYFDVASELERTLKAAGKRIDALKPSNARDGEIESVLQEQPLGLGHAVWCARDLVGDEPFAVLLPDDLMVPGALTGGTTEYRGISLREEFYSASLKLDYRLTRWLAFRASVTHERVDSSSPFSDYRATTYLVGLRLQP